MLRSGVFILILVICMLAACGGHTSRRPSALSLNTTTPSSQLPAGIDGSYLEAVNSLPADIRAEVDALVPPKGCNAEVFYALKKSFVQAMASNLANGGKITCTPPSGDNNKAAGLTVTPSGADYILSWNYRNIGDYDQGGTVGITDITPIAMHYGHTVGTDPLDAVIDGDGSGTIGIADVTPLAMYFGVNVTSYQVEEATSAGGPWTVLSSVPFTNGTGATEGWMRFEYTLPNDDERWLRVAPVDSTGGPGVPSDALQFGGGGTPPVIESVSPLSGATNSAVQFSAVVTGVGPFTYIWNFNGACTPDSSTDEQPNVVLSATPGDYDCTVEVTNDAGPTLFDFTVTVGAPPNATAVNPTGGVSGADVQFTVMVTGDAPLTYAWDFGGGATPNTSTDESPTVNLGAAGVYDTASVTVTNPFGESFYGFTLTVLGTTPPEIISVSPTTGYRGDEITISATINGTPPFTYDWDFGWAASPDESTDASPIIILEEPGVCPCKLDVTSPYGSDTYFFDLTVNHDPAYDEVEPNNSIPEANALPMPSVMDWHCRITETTDENDFFSFPGNFGDEVNIHALLDTNDPNIDIELQDSSGTVLASSNGTSDYEDIWYILSAPDTYYIRCYFAGYSIVNAGDYWLDVTLENIPLDEVENNDSMPEANSIAFPLEEFYGHCGMPGGYDGDDDDFFTFVAEANDRIYLTFDQTDDLYDLDIYLLDGNGDELAYSEDITGHEEFEYYFFPSDVGPYYIHVDACTGQGFYEMNGFVEPVPYWAETVVDDTTSSDLGEYSALVDADGHPASFYCDGSGGRLMYAYSDSEDGFGTWFVYTVASGDLGGGTCAATINGLPAAVYWSGSAMDFAICGSVDGSGIWTTSTVDTDVYSGFSVASVNGYPVVSYGNSSQELCFAINAETDGSGAWTTYTVTSDAPGAYSTSIIELSGGAFPGIAYDASDNGKLCFAVCDAWDGSGTWTIYDVADITAPSSVSAMNVTNKAAFAAVWNGRPTYFMAGNWDGSGGWAGWYASPLSVGTDTMVSMTSSWGWPRILFEDDQGDLWYAISANDNGQGEWLTRPVRENASVGSSRSLGYIYLTGDLCCVFYDHSAPESWVGFAVPVS